MSENFFITKTSSVNGKVRRGILYHSSESPQVKEVSILRIPAYSKMKTKDDVQMKFLGGLIRTRKTAWSKKIYLLGIKVYSTHDYIRHIENFIIEQRKLAVWSAAKNVERIISTAFLHQKTFGEFRNKHEHEVITLIGGGPTVSFFTPIKNSLYVGLNRSYIYDKVHFDYLFTIDKAGLDTGKDNYFDGFLNYDCIKFVGDQNLGKTYQIPQSFGNGNPSVRRFKTSAGGLPSLVALDIDCTPLFNSSSISVQAMQFILFTNPRKVYVVGIDCTLSKGEHFSGSTHDASSRNESASNTDKAARQGWLQLKDFVETYYPETEIISVNPVGLKGMFRDVYTQEYLEKHPEIDAQSVEILNSEH